MAKNVVRNAKKKLPPLHPGEVLREEFLIPMGISAYALAAACRVPRTRIERIVREEIGMTADTALRLAKFFGTSPQLWVNLQSHYDLETAEIGIAKDLDAIRRVHQAA